MRISAFAVFVLLMITSIIEWSLRWYAFAALLLTWALLSAIALVRRDRDGAAFRIGSLIKRAVLALLAVLLALSPALIFPQYKPLKTTGAYGIETVAYTYAASRRTPTPADLEDSLCNPGIPKTPTANARLSSSLMGRSE